MKVIYVNKVLSDKYMESKENTHFGLKHYKTVINCKDSEGVDCFWKDSEGVEHILFKVRRNVITPKIAKVAYDTYITSVNKNNKDTSKTFTNKPEKNIRIKSFRNHRSKITGFYDKDVVGLGKLIKGTNNVCRKTAFTRDNWNKWEKVIPFFELIGNKYKELAPKHYRKQLALFKKCPPGFQIGKTPFTTITSNYNWRTACHRDSGDYREGMGNLTVLGQSFEGCYLGFPQFGVAVDVRPGDTAIMDVHQWHCNTELKCDDINKIRLSFVSYFREKMVNCNKKKVIDGETYYYKSSKVL